MIQQKYYYVERELTYKSKKRPKEKRSLEHLGPTKPEVTTTTTQQQPPTEQQRPEIATPTTTDNTQPLAGDTTTPLTTQDTGDSISSHSSHSDSSKTIDRNLQNDDKEAVQKEFSNQIAKQMIDSFQFTN